MNRALPLLAFILFLFSLPASAVPPLLVWAVPSPRLNDNGAQGMVLDLVFNASNPSGTWVPPSSVDYSVPVPGAAPVTGSFNFTSQVNAQGFIFLPLTYSQAAALNGTASVNFTNPVNLNLIGPTYSGGITFTKRTLTVTGGTVTEGNSGTTVLPFTVAIEKAISEPITFTYFNTGGTAAAGADFTPVLSTGTIPAGALSTTINITVKGDTALEADETVSLDVSDVSVPVLRGTDTVGTIVNDDAGAPPTPVATAVTEVSGTGTVQAWFSVDLPVVRAVPVTCRVSTRNGTAVAGSDYNALVPTDITFAAGETRKWVSITVTASVAVEWNEQFFLDVEETTTHEIRSAVCTIARLVVTSFTRVAAGEFLLTFPSGLGQRYFVEEAPSPAGTWTVASSVLSGTAAPIAQPVFSSGGRNFFRVRTFTPAPPGTPAASS